MTCEKKLPVTLFHKDVTQAGGHSYQCKYCVKNKNAEYYKANKAKIKGIYRVADLRRKYGLTIADYEIMLANQGGKCAVCGSSEPRGRGHFYFDHDHRTGTLRGLLCNPCNIGLGMFRDSIDALKSAIKYLECNSPTSARQALLKQTV